MIRRKSPLESGKRPLQDGGRLRPPFTEASDATRLSFIGMSSNDTILVKPVSRIAAYD